MQQLTANPSNQEMGDCPQWYQDMVIGMVNRGKQMPRDTRNDENRRIAQSMNLIYGSRGETIVEKYDELRRE